MKRMQRVEQLLERWTTEQFDSEHVTPLQPQGCTAEWTGQLLCIDRSNASRDLNALVAQKVAIKIGGKPVLFFSRVGLRARWGEDAERVLADEYESWTAFANAVKGLEKAGAVVTSQDEPTRATSLAFDRLHGKNRSLKKPIELAKAAILYPPNGLHTLLTGPSGVGKTLFAESMYQFAVETGQLEPNAPYVAFNCADYSNNPQLLLAHLFGVEKGAYTGADRDRAGLVEKAHNGVLFLDEVHRLPPEGQEMLFQLLDRGAFRRMGEAEGERTANIRLMAATTEQVASALLMTFVRRIPMLIPIPSLAERTLEERFGLIQFLFAEESARVQRPFWIAPDVLKALLLFDCPANVGQLKSEIQLLSARAFLAQITDDRADMLNVLLDSASDHVREGLLRAPEHRQSLEEILQSVKKGLVVDGDDVQQEQSDDASLYEILEQHSRELRRRGMDEGEINNVLSANIDVYFRKFFQRVSQEFETRRQDIAKLVGDRFLQTVEELFELANRRLEREFPMQAVFGAALHMRSAADRIRNGTQVQNPNLPDLRTKSPQEYATAQAMAERFAERTGIVLPEEEIGFLSMILTSAFDTPFPKVGVLVIAHGHATATSMLEAANQLLGTAHGSAIDVPLHIDYDDVLELAVERAKMLHEGKGLLLLVDMGVLLSIGERVQERTGIEVRTLPQITTRTVLEAVRKAALSSCTLDSMYTSLQESAAKAQKQLPKLARQGVLPVVCITGQGSAVQVKAILEERLVVPKDFALDIVPVSLATFEETPERLRELLGDDKPLAIVGTFNPNVPGVPFISAPDVLSGEGLRRLSHLIGVALAPSAAESASEAAAPANDATIWEQLTDTFRTRVKRVNPYFAVPVIVQALDQLEAKLGQPLDLDLRIGVTMHLVLAVEKRFTQGFWPTERQAQEKGAIEGVLTLPAFPAIQEAFAHAGAALDVEIPLCEIAHIARLILQ